MTHDSASSRGPGRPKTRGPIRRIGLDLDEDLGERLDAYLARNQRAGRGPTTITDAIHAGLRALLARKRA